MKSKPQDELCPCGYREECGMWCGPGHTNGLCPPIGIGHITSEANALIVGPPPELCDCGRKPPHSPTDSYMHPLPLTALTEAAEFEKWLHAEISDSMEQAHVAHQLENEWTPEMNLLVSRIMERHQAEAVKLVVAELKNLRDHDDDLIEVPRLYRLKQRSTYNAAYSQAWKDFKEDVTNRIAHYKDSGTIDTPRLRLERRPPENELDGPQRGYL